MPSQDVADPWQRLMSVVDEAVYLWQKRLSTSVHAQGQFK